MAEVDILKGLNYFPFASADGLSAKLIDHDGPASYTTGGETVLASKLGFKSIAMVLASPSADGGDFVEGFVGAKKMGTSVKLVWSVRTTGAEEANATNLAAKSCKLLVIGFAG